MNKKTGKNKGITLIALVITIIVMLILVGVSISMAVNGGLFNYAGKAAGDTKNVMNKEQQLTNEIMDKYFKENNDENEPEEEIKIPEDLKTGDYVNYTPSDETYTVASGTNGSGYTENQTFTTDSTLKWRVLSINEKTGEVELISATATHALYLQGADGYNHGVDILNDLCEKLYSNEAGATARSINVEDVNAKTTYDYTEFTYIASGLNIKYGDTKQLSTYGTNYMKYPNLYSQELGYGTGNVFNQEGLNGSVGLKDGVTDEEGITTYSTITGSTNGNIEGTDPYVTYTSYCNNGSIRTYYPYRCLDNDLGRNTAPVNLFKPSKDMWLASRFVIFREAPSTFWFAIY